MRELMFIDCGREAPAQAETWAQAALAKAGVPEGEAAQAAHRLSDGVRAAVAAFDCAKRGPGSPKAMLALSDDEGELAFELVADGDPSRARAQACAETAWQAAERRVAGDGAFRLRMPARA